MLRCSRIQRDGGELGSSKFSEPLQCWKPLVCSSLEELAGELLPGSAGAGGSRICSFSCLCVQVRLGWPLLPQSPCPWRLQGKSNPSAKRGFAVGAHCPCVWGLNGSHGKAQQGTRALGGRAFRGKERSGTHMPETPADPFSCRMRKKQAGERHKQSFEKPWCLTSAVGEEKQGATLPCFHSLQLLQRRQWDERGGEE